MDKFNRMGDHKLKSIAKTADYTVEDGIDTIFCDATSGDIAITLPSASANIDRIIGMVKRDVSANKVTCNGQEATTQYKSLKMQSDGTNWIPLL